MHVVSTRFSRAMLGAILLSSAAYSAQAAVVASVTGNSTTGSFSSWPLTPNAGDSTAINANLSGFNSAENNYGSGPPTGGSLGQSFICTQSGTLSDIQLVISGIAPVTFNAALYDAGVTTALSNTGANAYLNGTPNGGSLVSVSSNMLPASSTGLTWNGYTQQGANAAVLNLHVDASDNVSLVAGHQYVVEISAASPSANLIWMRMANNAIDYPNGQAFRSRAPLNGNPARDMSLAVNVVVPEPAAASLLGVGAMMLKRRRK